MNTPLMIGLGLALLLVVAFVFYFNRLVRLRQNVRESWSAIDTELKRRYDLIPNLVETVKGYAAHEQQTLEGVIAARNAAASNTGPAPQQAQSQDALSGALRQLFAVAESYPQLKANENFSRLQSELGETETRISQARRFFNANVRELNTAVETFPSSLIASGTGFHREQYFEVDGAARDVVAVKF